MGQRLCRIAQLGKRGPQLRKRQNSLRPHQPGTQYRRGNDDRQRPSQTDPAADLDEQCDFD